MKASEQQLKEKEQAQKLKALRRELEEKIEEQIPEGLFEEGIRVEVQKINEGEPLEPARAKQVIEALLFASSRSLPVADIRRIVKLSPKEIETIIDEIRADFEQQGRSFEVIEIAGGYEIATRKEFAPWIFKIELQKKAKQVTQSALETLAILAYKQPITRAEIEDIRGVDVSGVVNTLVERGLIKIVGKKEVPGRPFLYGTTEKFLEHFGLGKIEELPDIGEIKTLVDNSVKREDLIGTQKMVAIPQEENPQTQGEESPAAPAEEEGSDESEQSPEKN